MAQVQFRHYICPFFHFRHPKAELGAAPRVICMVNGKRQMPPRGARWEGSTLLFGGGANKVDGREEEETRVETIIREAREELGWDISRYDLTHALQTHDPYPLTITAFFAGDWTQQRYRVFAGKCEEGIVDTWGPWDATKFQPPFYPADLGGILRGLARPEWLSGQNGLIEAAAAVAGLVDP